MCYVKSVSITKKSQFNSLKVNHYYLLQYIDQCFSLENPGKCAKIQSSIHGAVFFTDEQRQSGMLCAWPGFYCQSKGAGCFGDGR